MSEATMMQALVLRDFGSMAVEELPVGRPGPGEVLIRTTATGICGSDVHGFTGENGRRAPGQVMGHETEGRIEDLGPGVTGLALGDRVTFNPVVVPPHLATEFLDREQQCPDRFVIGVRADYVAAFAELVVVPAPNVVPVPGELPWPGGALIEPFAVAVHALRRGQIRPDHTALVTGGGPIGQSLIVALRAIGVDGVIVTEVDPKRRDLCAELGAIVVDPREDGATDDALRPFGGAVSHAFDAVGMSATLATALAATSLGGIVCLVGMAQPRVELDAYAVSTAERTIVGSFTYGSGDFRAAATLLASDPDLALRLISERVPLSQGPEAFAAQGRGEVAPGKVVVDFTS